MPSPAPQAALPFSRPLISEAAIAAVGDVLRSGWITSGPRVLEFEREFAASIGARHAVAVGSATAGLDIAVQALDLQPGDEVIVPSIDWVSGPNVIELNGAQAVLCDVHADTMQIDAASVARLITPRTRAVMPVHFAGAPCDLAALRDVIAGRPIAIIEDAAHAVGTLDRGRPVGRSSRCAVFSFHPSKNMTTGEGGMVVSDDDDLAARLRLLRFHGIRKDAWKNHARNGRDVYEVLQPARKCNLTDIQAVIGLHQLREVGGLNAQRARLAAAYGERFGSIRCATPLALPVHADDRHSWHLYVVRIELERLRIDRAGVVDALEQLGIGTAIHYPAVHRQRHYAARYPGMDLPVADRAHDRLLSLPLFPGMTRADVDRVADAFAAIDSDLGR